LSVGVTVIRADLTGGPRLLSGLAVQTVCPDIAWSPDGRQLAYRQGLDDGATGNIRVVVMNSNGSNAHRRTGSKVVEMYPVWSPSGDRIAFGRRVAGDPTNGSPLFQLVVVHPDGTGAVNVDAPDPIDYAGWTWSPDGTQLLVISASGSYLLDPSG